MSVCSSCGLSHAAPFSDELLALARQLASAGDTEERHHLMAALADMYADIADETDMNLPEELHVLCSEYLTKRTETAGAALQLGRLLVRLTDAYERHLNSTKTKNPSPSPNAAPKNGAGLN